jgi:hypothetical protein
MTFAFIERQAALPFCDNGAEPIAIANPLSEKFAVLGHRSSRGSRIPAAQPPARPPRRAVVRNRQPLHRPRRGHASRSRGRGGVNARRLPRRCLSISLTKGTVRLLAAAFGAGALDFPSERAYLVRGRAADVSPAARGSAWSGSRQDCRARELPPGEDLRRGTRYESARRGASDSLRAEPRGFRQSFVTCRSGRRSLACRLRSWHYACGGSFGIGLDRRIRSVSRKGPRRSRQPVAASRSRPGTCLTDDEAQKATERIVDTLRSTRRTEIEFLAGCALSHRGSGSFWESRRLEGVTTWQKWQYVASTSSPSIDSRKK